MDVVVPVRDFNAALWKRFQEGRIRNVFPKSKYNDILNKIKTLEGNPPRNSPEQYYLLRKFVVVKVGQTERLACKNDLGIGLNGSVKFNSSNIKFYVALEEIYDFIDEAHKVTNHGGRDKIVRVLQQQGIVNVARDTVELYLSHCNICRPRRKEFLKRFYSKVVSTQCSQYDAQDDAISGNEQSPDRDQQGEQLPDDVDRSSVCMDDIQESETEIDPNLLRGHIGILDFSSAPDGDYKFILLYIDYETTFCILRPLKCKCIYEVVSHLLDIFTLIGAPQILYGECDSSFLLSVIQELKSSWPECVIVCGSEKLLDKDLKNLADKCIADVREMLKNWMLENNSSRWSFGLKFTQLRKNTKLEETQRKSPYENLFNRASHHGIPAHIDISVLTSIQKEEELMSVINSYRCSENEPFEHLQVSLDPNVCSLVQNGLSHGKLIETVVPTECSVGGENIKPEPIDDTDESQGSSLSPGGSNCGPPLQRIEVQIKQEPSDSS